MSKVIFKLTFKHPNFKDTTSKNVSHVKYIATRSGVDKTVTESDLNRELQKGIEDLSSDDDTYVRYIDERPRSHGLFGKDGIEDLQEVQEEISHVESFIWRGIVSLKEVDAQRLGYLNKEEWQNVLRLKVPEMAEKIGIRASNLRWVSAIHMEKGHPHAHIMFWEKKPERTIGVVKPKVLEDIRKMYTDEIFEEERLSYINEKNVMRDLIRDLAKDDVAKAAQVVREVRKSIEDINDLIGIQSNSESVVPRLYSDEERDLVSKLKTLGDMLPGKGRTALKFMPQDVKEKVREIADYLLKQPEFSASVHKNLNAVENLTRLYTSDDKAIEQRVNQYLYVIDNLAYRFSSYGLESESIKEILKLWSDSQSNDIKLSPEIRNRIIEEVDLQDNSIIDLDNDNLDIATIKLFEDIVGDVQLIRTQYIENKLNEQNELLNELIENKFVFQENNTYSLTEKANNSIKLLYSQSELDKEVLQCIGQDGASLESILNNSKVNHFLKSDMNNKGTFIVSKYDATVIKGYFGNKNELELKDLKGIIKDKFKLKSKQDEEFKIVSNRISKLKENGIIGENTEGKLYITNKGNLEFEQVNKIFKFTSYDANVIGNYIDRSEGRLSKEQLKEFVMKEYNNDEDAADKLNYILRRLDKNIESGYIIKENDEEGNDYYCFSKLGTEKREEIQDPSRYKIKTNLNNLEELGILEQKDDRYFITEDFKLIIDNDVLEKIEEGTYSLEEINEYNNELTRNIVESLSKCDCSYNSLKDRMKFKDLINPIEKARDNAYEDIIDRVSQIILKGAVQGQKDNVFYVDNEKSYEAIRFIKDISAKINVVPEQIKVLNQVALVLSNTGHDKEKIINTIKSFIENEKLTLNKDHIESIVDNIKNDSFDNSRVQNISGKKEIEHYFSVLKATGYLEIDAYRLVNESIKGSASKLDDTMKDLKNKGIVYEEDGAYKLTNEGIKEFIKVKEIDKSEKNIFQILKNNDGFLSSTSFEELLENKDLFSNLRNKDPEELKLTKYDLKVYSEFGEDNKITLKQLEENIYSKYSDKEDNINLDKAEAEIDALKYRIDKLTVNGYIKFDKESGVYSFTQESIDELEHIKDKMEFTRYDANVTLSYIDKAEDNILRAENLFESLQKEIVNKTAQNYYNIFSNLIENKDFNKLNEYINIDEKGNLTSSEKGKSLGIELNKVSNYFYEAKGKLTEEKLKQICIAKFGEENWESSFKGVLTNINRQLAKGHINKDINGVYSIDNEINDINKFLYQIYKAGGNINKENLKEVLESNIPNKEAESQFKYLIKRLDFLKHEGYVSGIDNQYELTAKGIDKRENILTPQREILKNKLEYLEKLGFLSKDEGGYVLTSKYYEYEKNVTVARENKVIRSSDYITKEVADLIDKTQDKVNVGKIERTNERICTGIYINNEYEDIKSDYSSIRSYGNITDTVRKTINHLSVTMLVSGLSLESTKEILNNWNDKSNSNINSEEIEQIINEAYEVVEEDKLWGNTTIISSKDWKEMFKSLGVQDENIPKWIYKGENWKEFNKGLGLYSMVNDVWKAVWSQLEKQRLQVENQAQYLKKQLLKQQGSQGRSAMIEQIRKSKDKNALYHDDDLER